MTKIATRKLLPTLITFIVLLLIILYHIYTHTTFLIKIKRTKLGRRIDRLFTDADSKPKPERHWNPSSNDDIHKLLDMIDCPGTTFDYAVPLKQKKPVKPTQSAVELHHSHDLAASDPERVTVANTQHISGAAETVQVKVKEAVSQM